MDLERVRIGDALAGQAGRAEEEAAGADAAKEVLGLPIFGTRFTGSLEDFFEPSRLETIRPNPNADSRINLSINLNNDPSTAPSTDLLAAFAPTTLEVAASGDPVAREIGERGAKALAETVEVTAARTNLIAPEIVMVGGILKSEVMLEPLRAHLLARLPEMRLVAAELSPAHGACLLARALL